LVGAIMSLSCIKELIKTSNTAAIHFKDSDPTLSPLLFSE